MFHTQLVKEFYLELIKLSWLVRENSKTWEEVICQSNVSDIGFSHCREVCENGESKFGSVQVVVVDFACIKPWKACPRVWEKRVPKYSFTEVYTAEWFGDHNELERQLLLAERRTLEKEIEDIKKPSDGRGNYAPDVISQATTKLAVLIPHVQTWTFAARARNTRKAKVKSWYWKYLSRICRRRRRKHQKSFSLSSSPRNVQSIFFAIMRPRLRL